MAQPLERGFFILPRVPSFPQLCYNPFESPPTCAFDHGKTTMPSITSNAHFDGQQITLDEPFEIPSNARLLVTILETSDLERDDWMAFSGRNLAEAYSDDEADYPLSAIMTSWQKPEFGL
jgi:hypothetical protein